MQDVFLEKTVAAFLKNMSVGAQDGIIVALSGGADSMALLCALHAVQQNQPLRLLAAHVHHGLRGEEADHDAAFVEQQCKCRQIPLEVLRTDVKAKALPGEGVEQAGRRIRYAFFDRLRQQYAYRYVATAHTADDNLETVLLHLTRGSGLHGLCGIQPENDGILRPLLTCSRMDIETYCDEKGIPFITDSTNADMAYSRNRIRHAVIPQLKALNPQVVEACTRLTANLRQEDALLEALACELLSNAVLENGVYDRAVLSAAAVSLRRRVLKMLMESNGGDCGEIHILLAEKALLSGNGAVQVPGGVLVTADAVALKIGPPTLQTEIPYFEMPVTIGQRLTIADRQYIPLCLSLEEYEQKRKVYKKVLKFTCDYDKITHSLTVRQRKPGDAFHPVGGVGKSLKKYFNEKNVPLAQRAETPIVCDEQGIVLVTGFSCDDRVKLDQTTKRVFILCLAEEEKSCEYTQ